MLIRVILRLALNSSNLFSRKEIAAEKTQSFYKIRNKTKGKSKMSPSDIIRLILNQIRDRQMNAGDTVVIPVNWKKGVTNALKTFMHQHWKTVPRIEGTGSIRTCTVTVNAAMLAGTT